MFFSRTEFEESSISENAQPSLGPVPLTKKDLSIYKYEDKYMDTDKDNDKFKYI